MRRRTEQKMVGWWWIALLVVMGIVYAVGSYVRDHPDVFQPRATVTIPFDPTRSNGG